MDAQLRRMSDEIEINRLLAAYSHAVMRLDPAGAAAVYAEDGVLSAFNGPDIVGRTMIEATFVKVFAPVRFLIQNCGAVVIEVDGDRARASSSVSELLQSKGSDQVSCCFGNYDDDLVRTADGWRFAKRRFNPFYRGNLQSEGKQYDDPAAPHTYAPWPLAL
jgi:ketosteroid isomerase-like protein